MISVQLSSKCSSCGSGLRNRAVICPSPVPSPDDSPKVSGVECHGPGQLLLKLGTIVASVNMPSLMLRRSVSLDHLNRITCMQCSRTHPVSVNILLPVIPPTPIFLVPCAVSLPEVAKPLGPGTKVCQCASTSNTLKI